ncbi:MAG: DUF3198 domain-containing protein [Candidatus Thermoplasmatota archaeon]|nr:DUF3198 domain-containing protein [Candidatus Thermoplasmatota archaeon]
MNKMFREHMLVLSAVMFGVGIIMTILGFLWYYFTFIQSIVVNTPIEGFAEKVGEWGWWILISAPFILIAGIWYFFDQVMTRKKFNKLVSPNSKANFVKNISEIEEVIWNLPKKYRERFEEKKKNFKIK